MTCLIIFLHTLSDEILSFLGEGYKLNNIIESTGRIKWYNDLQGFGVIVDDTSGEEVFVHHSSVQLKAGSELEEGEPVRYQAFLGDRGYQACKVRSTK